MKQFLRRWRKNEDGASVIEFALLGPIFIALLCGVMYFGVFAFNAHRIDNTARDAARYAMLLNNPTLEEVEAEVSAVFDQAAISGVNVDVTFAERSDGGQDAVIVASYEADRVSAYLNTKGFVHTIELRAPLRQQ